MIFISTSNGRRKREAAASKLQLPPGAPQTALLESAEWPRTRGLSCAHSPGPRLAAPVLYAASEEPQASVGRRGCAADEPGHRGGPGQERVVLCRHLREGRRARPGDAAPAPPRHAPPARPPRPFRLSSGRPQGGARPGRLRPQEAQPPSSKARCLK